MEKTIMMKSLLAGAAAVALIATAAIAQGAFPEEQAAQPAPAPVASVDPRIFDPTQTTTYTSRAVTHDGETAPKSKTTTTANPADGATRYTRAVNGTDK
jgi:ABC-type oligopeptide transport system substrate-binding subunit